MRSAPAVITLLVFAGACGSDADDPVTESTTTIEQNTEDEMTEPATDPNEATDTDSDTETGTDDPVPTLELNPPKTSGPVAPTTAGEPVGGDDSLYPGQIDPGLDPFVDMAIADLAPRLGVDPDEITTISAKLVTWSDSSMGSPLPGMQYAQALQDGSLIELGYDNKVYRYHSGGERSPFLCDAPLAAPPVTGGAADL